jgi:hypothetical membrane protein
MAGTAAVSGSTRILLGCGVLGPLLFMAIFAVEGTLRAAYDPLKHQVSLLSLTERGWIQVGSFLLNGALVVAFAAGLRRILVAGRAAVGGPTAVAIAGIGIVVAGLFSMQPSFGYPPGAPPGVGSVISIGSYVHVLGAVLFFVGMTAASLLFAARFRSAGRSLWSAYSALTGAAILIFFAASSGGGQDDTPFVPEYAGLLQRVAIVAGLVWMTVLAAGILRGKVEAPTAGD